MTTHGIAQSQAVNLTVTPRSRWSNNILSIRAIDRTAPERLEDTDHLGHIARPFLPPSSKKESGRCACPQVLSLYDTGAENEP